MSRASVVRRPNPQEAEVWGSRARDLPSADQLSLGFIPGLPEYYEALLLVHPKAQRAMVLVDMNRREVVHVNDAAILLFGFDSGERTLAHEFIHATAFNPEGPLARSMDRAGILGEFDETAVMSTMDRRGGNLVVETHLRSMVFGEQRHLLAVLRDITDRERTEGQLRQVVSILEATLDSTADGLLVADLQGRLVRHNRRFLEIWNVPEDLVGASDDERLMAHLRGQVREQDAFMRRIGDYWAEPNAEGYDRLWCNDGRVIELYTIPQRVGGVVAGRVYSFRDVTKRQQAEERLQSLKQELEERVEERTADLEAANRELESFSFTVSHDLRAPLRAIDGFSQALEEDHSGALDEDAVHLIGRIRAATGRMSELIENLLALARVTRVEPKMEDVDLGAMAQEIADRLRTSEPGRNVEFVIDRPPPVRGDGPLLRSALDNMLSNAWKFTSRHERARIEFGQATKAAERVFFVRDDGAGFDPSLAGRLFAPFQRLHGQREFEGTGVGLATVQRIVQRHGGRVWAEGKPEAGSCFYFTLGRGGKPR